MRRLGHPSLYPPCRFDFSRGLGVKLGTSIDYGEYLDIRPYTSDNSVSHVTITMTTRVSYYCLTGCTIVVSLVCSGGTSRLLHSLRPLYLLCEELEWHLVLHERCKGTADNYLIVSLAMCCVLYYAYV